MRNVHRQQVTHVKPSIARDESGKMSRKLVSVDFPPVYGFLSATNTRARRKAIEKSLVPTLKIVSRDVLINSPDIPTYERRVKILQALREHLMPFFATRKLDFEEHCLFINYTAAMLASRVTGDTYRLHAGAFYVIADDGKMHSMNGSEECFHAWAICCRKGGLEFLDAQLALRPKPLLAWGWACDVISDSRAFFRPNLGLTERCLQAPLLNHSPGIVQAIIDQYGHR